MRERIRNIYKEKQALVAYYVRTKSDPVKQRIVEQALNLVIVYFKLMLNYSIRIKEVNSANVQKSWSALMPTRENCNFLQPKGRGRFGKGSGA